MMRTCILFLTIINGADGQDFPQPNRGVDQIRVDAAIEKGAKYLLSRKTYPDRNIPLVLYTLLHAGIDRENQKFQEYLQGLLGSPLETTYTVAIQAMLLQELDAVTYQWRIAQCAQFLVDNQLKNGQWDYGEPTYIPVNSRAFRPTRKKGSTRISTRIIRIQPQRQKKGFGDNSNSQYAILGLRACMEACVFPPRKSLDRALRWWYAAQNKDGGWEYRKALGKSYGSMTAGALGCVAILTHYLKKNWKRDSRLKRSVDWMDRYISVKKNPRRDGNRNYYYYLYALERAGILTDIRQFGKIDWYREGANHLLDTQKSNGAWGTNSTHTCFSILFLRRGTPALPKVATGR